MAQGTLPKREHWLAITVSPRGGSVAVLGGSIALVLLAVACALFATMSAFIRLRLPVLIGSMINRLSQLHVRSMGAAPETVLSLCSEMTMVDNAMFQVKYAGKNDIYRIEGL